MARRAAWSRRARCRAKGSRRPPCWSGTGGPACACRRCSSTLCPPRLHRQPCGRFASRLARRWRAAWARGPGSTAPSPTTTSRTERGEECTWCTSTEETRASCPSTTPTSCAASLEGRRSRGTSARRRWRWPRRRPSPSTRRAVGSRSACGTRARPQEWRTRSASGRGGGRSIKQSGGMELPYQTLAAGTFSIGGTPTFYETAFFHRASRSLIVTDALARGAAAQRPGAAAARLEALDRRPAARGHARGAAGGLGEDGPARLLLLPRA
mmetsp:Transcript_31571/g.104246  ORF Transcript_31571/g.104246 Transcript_31571/m.104246 type:complete len:268 (-) Transcript_31571:440-1243(-)